MDIEFNNNPSPYGVGPMYFIEYSDDSYKSTSNIDPIFGYEEIF